MPHKIGKQSNIIILLQKVLGIAVTERVRIYYLFIKSVLLSVVFELLGDTSCGYTLTKTIKEQVARCTLLGFEPFKRFVTEFFRDIQSAELTALRIKIEITCFNVFYLNADQLINILSRVLGRFFKNFSDIGEPLHKLVNNDYHSINFILRFYYTRKRKMRTNFFKLIHNMRVNICHALVE